MTKVIDKRIEEYRHVGVGTFRASDLAKKLINEVLDSGRISYGPFSQQFERRFAELHACKYAILSNSGTSALHVALQALKELHGWKDGSNVILPATTFVATANIILHNRLVPRFVDVDPITYNINVSQAHDAIDRETVAIIPVHLFGQSANMDGLIAAIKLSVGKNKIKLVEDSCETMLASHNGRSVGSMGDIGCFSTYVAHLLVTGVGGISTTNDPDYAAKMRSLVNHGLTIENLNPDNNFSPQPAIGRRFAFDTAGHSFRITEMEAALGLAQLEELEDNIRTRRRNACHLIAGLYNVNKHYGRLFQTPIVAAGNTHSFMMFPIVMYPEEDGTPRSKEALIAHLNARGIETRDMLPIINQPMYSYLNPAQFPVSRWILNSGFYIGCHQDLTTDDIQYVIDTISEYYANEQRAGGLGTA